MVLPKLQYCRVTSKLCDGGVICGRVNELSSPYEAVDRHFCNFFPPCERDLRSIASPAPPQLPIMDAGSPVGQPRPRIGLPVPATAPPPTLAEAELLLAPPPPPLDDATELAEVSTAPVELLWQPPTPLMRSCRMAERSDVMPIPELLLKPLLLLLPMPPPPAPRGVLLLLVEASTTPPPPPAPPPPPPAELDASPFICTHRVCVWVWRMARQGGAAGDDDDDSSIDG